jgi:hypothetical protein
MNENRQKEDGQMKKPQLSEAELREEIRKFLRVKKRVEQKKKIVEQEKSKRNKI